MKKSTQLTFIVIFLLIFLILSLCSYKLIALLLLLIFLAKIYKDFEKVEKNCSITIRESNHRIKNNISILTNIIDLKKFTYDDLGTIELLDDLRNKTILISNIHEKIYESCNVKNIFIKSYIEDVMKITNSFYDNSINIFYDIDDCLIKSKFAVDVVLIIQEFFTNAVKYAYDKQANKRFFIHFKKLNNSEYLIKMSDNGSGFKNIDLNKISNFGLNIAQAIIDQYDGKIELSNDNGARVEIYLTNKFS